MKRPICPYCNGRTRLTTGKETYPFMEELASRKYWICRPCQAWTPTKFNSIEPWGVIANKHTRNLRIQAHAHFDKLWKSYSGSKKARSKQRAKCYKWLQYIMRMNPDQAHIRNFNDEQCYQLLKHLGVSVDEKNEAAI